MSELRGVLGRLEQRLGPITEGPRPLEGGITNRNYRVSFGACDCVVRLPGKDSSLLGISRRAERIANSTAAELGLAPPVVAGDDECLVTEYAHGVPGTPGTLRLVPEAVAVQLRKFHDSAIPLGVTFWVPELLERYAELVREHGGSVPDRYADVGRLANRIGEALPLSEPVPCHNDLLAANFLSVGDGGAVLLVDWEYAGMGHRLFDLGNFAVNCELDDAAEVRLLTAYFGEQPSADRVAALRLMRIMSDAREAAWGVIQSVISELEFDFAEYASRHFDRLEREASSDEFEEWLDAASA
jgi:thiamine kinase-like enzyme